MYIIYIYIIYITYIIYIMLIVEGEYSRNNKNLQLPIQIELSKQEKTLCQFYCIFGILLYF